jgi:hypothetical protein
MPSLFDQISQLSATAAVAAPEGDADNDSWIDDGDESEEL